MGTATRPVYRIGISGKKQKLDVFSHLELQLPETCVVFAFSVASRGLCSGAADSEINAAS